MGGARWLLVLILLAGCQSGLQRVESTEVLPAQRSADAEQCWDEAIDRDLAFHTVLLDVSETHRRQGSAATYQTLFVGRTNVADHWNTTLVRVPLPDWIAEKIRKRLMGVKPETLRLNWQGTHWWCSGGDLLGCSEDEANEIWKKAAEKYWRGEPLIAPASKGKTPEPGP